MYYRLVRAGFALLFLLYLSDDACFFARCVVLWCGVVWCSGLSTGRLFPRCR